MSTSTAHATDQATRAVLWNLAWPVVLLGWLRTLTLVVDAGFVGALGPVALAALGGSAFAFWMVDQLAELPGVGLHSRSARCVGEARADKLAGCTLEALLTGAGLALVVGLGARPAANAYVALLGFEASGEEAALTVSFLVALMQGALGIVLLSVANGLLRGLGWTRAALGITTLALALNTALDPVLIWGLPSLGLPALGIAGAAWATTIGSAVGGLVGLAYAAAQLGRSAWPADGTVPRAAWAGMSRTVAIGGPMAVSGIGFSFVYVVLGRLLTGFGPASIAALGIGHRLEGFAFLTAIGGMMAVGTAVGQRLGAGDVQGAWHAVRVAERMVLIAMVAWGVLLYVGVGPAYALLTDDVAVAEAGVRYLRVQCMVWAFMGLHIVYEGAFTGVGRTLPSLWVTGFWSLARVPLAYLFALGFGLGPMGVWYAIALSTVIKGVHMRLRFWSLVRRGAPGFGAEVPAPVA